MDGEAPLAAELAQAVDGIAGDVHHAATDLGARGHGDGAARALDFEPAAEPVGGIHCDAADGILTYMLLDFDDEFPAVRPDDFEGVMDSRERFLLLEALQIEVNIHYWTDYLGDTSLKRLRHRLG